MPLWHNSVIKNIFQYRRCIALAWACWLMAGIGWPASAFADMPSPEDPIQINADRMNSRSEAGTTEFIGNVHAVQGDLEVDCERLVVHHTSSARGKQGRIQKVVAMGNTRIRLENRDAYAEKATYIPNRNLLILSGGEARIREGENYISGSRVTYNRESGRIRVEASGRKQVTAQFFSRKEEEPPTEKKSPRAQPTNSAAPAVPPQRLSKTSSKPPAPPLPAKPKKEAPAAVAKKAVRKPMAPKPAPHRKGLSASQQAPKKPVLRPAKARRLPTVVGLAPFYDPTGRRKGAVRPLLKKLAAQITKQCRAVPLLLGDGNDPKQVALSLRRDPLGRLRRFEMSESARQKGLRLLVVGQWVRDYASSAEPSGVRLQILDSRTAEFVFDQVIANDPQLFAALTQQICMAADNATPCGFVIAADAGKVQVAAGALAGLRVGEKLAVYDSYVVVDKRRRKFFADGRRRALAVVEDVTQFQATAKIVSGRSVRAGSVVVPLSAKNASKAHP